MKKSTKLITTAIALALVVAAMVVGIYAATSASAGITANVSWTATAGLEFHVGAWTYGAKESGTNGDSGTQQKNKVSVDTTTSNQAATNMGFALNTTFEDTSNEMLIFLLMATFFSLLIFLIELIISNNVLVFSKLSQLTLNEVTFGQSLTITDSS